MKLTKTLGVLLVSVALLTPLSRGSPTGEGETFWCDRSLKQMLHQNVSGPGVRALQDLIASAPPGATLRVPQGVYAGSIIIDKPLAVISEGAILDGQGQGTLVHIIAPDVTLKGFVLRNSGRSLAHEDSAILVEAPRAHIEENTLSHVLFGIYLKNAPGSVIRRNTITGLSVPEAERGDAIRLWYSSDVTVEENQTHNARDVIVWYSRTVLLRKNHFAGGRYGIHLMYAKEIQIEENTLLKNFVGVYAMYSQGLTIQKNLFMGHRGPSGYGVGLKDTDDALIAENVIADNSVGVFLDNSPSSVKTPVLFRKNLFAYNETAVMMLPSVRGDVFSENSFIENFEHVGIAGGGQPEGNLWAKNFWGDYLGYDADGDGVGDLAYKSERLFEHLIDRYPQLRLFLYSPAIQALEFAARAVPLFQPQPKLTDPQPLMAPALPALALADFGASNTISMKVVTGGLIIIAIGAIFGFGWGFLRLLPLSPRPFEGEGRRVRGQERNTSRGEGKITVRNLTKRFGPVTAVEDLSFTVRTGEALALWGPNGAGKSTVLHCLLGLLQYDGTIELDGHDPRRYGKEARRLIGFVPQHIQIPDDFTVDEALIFFARLKGVSPEAVPNVMQRLGLDEFSRKRIGALSGGMKQRLALAIALLGDPPILLLDEPTASLDAQSREDLLRLLVELKRSGKTLLFSSHRQDEILAIADRVLVLEQGRLMRIEQIGALSPVITDGRGAGGEGLRLL
ncbi:MAG: nitrous oxide reductase family maturation protein NosD [Candidatus Bipolaricaulia bacterium]